MFKKPTPPAPPSPAPSHTSDYPRLPPRIFEDLVAHKPSFAQSNAATSPLAADPELTSPDTVLGEAVSFKGQLCFKNLLRIEGTFEGELISEGKIIVGPKGVVKANINMREAVIEGRVEGNITIKERLELRGDAHVIGDITAKFMSMDEGVTLLGHVCIAPQDSTAPNL